ncbi:MAG: acyl--CoA ligase [Cyanobacteria bacterium]|nr:acyl--CoA ligase [Cyanobacteriota bacterium]
MNAAPSLFERIRKRCSASSPPQYLDLATPAQPLASNGGVLIGFAERIAAALHVHAPGPFVVLLLDRCSTFMPAFWGCLRAGKTVLPLPIAAASGRPKAYELEQLAELMEGLGPVAVVVDESSMAARDWFPTSLDLYWLPWSLLLTTATQAGPDGADSELAFVLQTSGTTGDCKYAAFSGDWFDYEKCNTKRVLSLFPLASSTGIGFAYGLNGLSAYLPLSQAVRNPDLLFAAIETHRLEVVVMPPVMVLSLLRAVATASAPLQRRDLSSLIRVNVGSSTIPLEAIEQLDALLQQWGASPGLIHFAYGLTETGGVAFGPFHGVAEHRHSDGLRIGPISDGVELRIEAERLGEPGLIMVKRPFTFLGYLQLEGEIGWQLQPFDSGDAWFKTGDLGLMEGDALVLSGRLKDTIVLNSRKISLAAVERHLQLRWPELLEEVVACAGPQEQLLVVVVQSPGLVVPLQQLRQAIATELLRQFGLPLAELAATDAAELPRTSTGKLQKRLVVERWGSQLDPVSAEGLDSVGSTPATEGVVALLLAEMRRHAAVYQPNDPSQRLSAFGIDSLALAQIIGNVERSSGLSCQLEACPPDPRVQDLAHLFGAIARSERAAAPLVPGVLLADLSRYPQRQAIAEQIRAANLQMAGESVGPDHVIRRLNPDAQAVPLVLMGRLSGPFVQRLASLLPEHPIYYLRVLHDYGSPANHSYLCSCCVDWLEAALPACNPVLVGECLAGVLALDVARQLWRREHAVRLTVLMNWNVGRDHNPETYSGLCAYHIHEFYWGDQPHQREQIEADLRQHTPNTALIYWAAARQQNPSQYIDPEATPEILETILRHPALRPVLMA